MQTLELWKPPSLRFHKPQWFLTPLDGFIVALSSLHSTDDECFSHVSVCPLKFVLNVYLSSDIFKKFISDY
jgi:hypothetical protein